MPSKPDSTRQTNIAQGRLIAAGRKALQSAEPEEALFVWKFLKQAELKRLGFNEDQIEYLVGEKIKELGATCIAEDTAKIEASQTSINTADSSADSSTPLSAETPQYEETLNEVGADAEGKSATDSSGDSPTEDASEVVSVPWRANENNKSTLLKKR